MVDGDSGNGNDLGKPEREGVRAGNEDPLPEFEEASAAEPSYISNGVGASWLDDVSDEKEGEEEKEEPAEVVKDDAPEDYQSTAKALSSSTNTPTGIQKPTEDGDGTDGEPEAQDTEDVEMTDEEGAQTINEEPPSAQQSPQATEFTPPPASGSGSAGMRRFRTTKFGGARKEVVVGLSAWKRGAPLGAGGQGEVYAGKHEFSGLEVAIKTVRLVASKKTGSNTDSALDLLLKEAQALAQYQHPNIVRLLDFQEIEREPSKHEKLTQLNDLLSGNMLKKLQGKGRQDALAEFYARQETLSQSGPLEYMMVMEFMKGGSLLTKMIKKTVGEDGVEQKIAVPLDANDAVNIIRKVGAGLQAVHNKGVLHRDIKPENIMFDENDEPKLGDFGLAFGLEQKAQGIAGSPFYLSPEQAMNGAVLDVRTDVYLLAATLYHALTGSWRMQTELSGKHDTAPANLHPGTIVKEVLRTYQLRSVLQLRGTLGERDKDLSAIVMKGLSFDAEDRYASVDDFCADLARWQNDERVVARLNPNIEDRMARAEKYAEDNVPDEDERIRLLASVKNELSALPYSKSEERAYKWRKGGKRKTILWSSILAAAGIVGSLVFAYGASTYERIESERMRRAQAVERREALLRMEGEISSGVAQVTSASSLASVDLLSKRIEQAYLFAIENRELVPEAKSAVPELEARKSWIQSLRSDVSERDRVQQVLAGAAKSDDDTVFDVAQKTIAAYRSVGGDSAYARSAAAGLVVRLDRSVADVHGAVRAQYVGIAQIDSRVLNSAREQVTRAQSMLEAAREVRGGSEYTEELHSLAGWSQALASAYQGQIEESLRTQSTVAATPLRDVLVSASEADVRRFAGLAQEEVAMLESRVKHGAAALAQYQAAMRADPSWLLVAEKRDSLSLMQNQDEQRLTLVRGSAQVSAGILEYHTALREERFGDAFRKLSEVYGMWPERLVLDLMEQVKDRDKAQMMRRAFVGMQSVLDYGAEVRALYDSYYLNEFDGAERELDTALRKIQSQLERRLRPASEAQSRRLPDDVYAGLLERSRTLETDARNNSQRRFGQVRIDATEQQRREAQGHQLDDQFELRQMDYETYTRERARLRTQGPANRSGQK